MKQKSEQQALFALTSMCSTAEHCQQDMIEKLQKWQIPEEVQARIMAYLIKEKYVDDARYARFFINDKIKYNKWGRRKIEQALYKKRIPKDISDPVFEEIEDEEYLEVLRPLIISKAKTVKAKTEYEKNMKLIKFALSRGFDMRLIRKCIDNIQEIDDFDDF